MSNELAELSTLNYTNTPTDAKSEKSSLLLPICPRRKIKVFISSICGNEKYDKIRDDLKKRIESTQLATAYAFEKEPASTLSAEVHYESNLKESDICIFLIDNADGVTSGVQKEIEIVKSII